jgi:hypothetical protein
MEKLQPSTLSKIKAQNCAATALRTRCGPANSPSILLVGPRVFDLCTFGNLTEVNEWWARDGA